MLPHFKGSIQKIICFPFGNWLPSALRRFRPFSFAPPGFPGFAFIVGFMHEICSCLEA